MTARKPGTTRQSASFVHLYAHSDYSFYQSTATIFELVTEAVHLGMHALALTDTGNVYGAIEFYRECRRQNIKPIVGSEVLVQGTYLPKRLILLARDITGYRNLVRLYDGLNPVDAWGSSAIDEERILADTTGLLCIIPGVSVVQPDPHRYFAKLEGAFEIGSLFLGIEPCNCSGSATDMQQILSIARQSSIMPVAIHDIRSVYPDDNPALFRSIGHDRIGYECPAPEPTNDQHWLCGNDEMINIFAGLPEAINNTLVIARMINLEFGIENDLSQRCSHPIAEKKSSEDDPTRLRRLTTQALAERYTLVDQMVKDRLDQELAAITHQRLDGLFLMLADIVSWARRHDLLVGCGFGVAPSSLVNYLLGISGIDPLRFGLVFERLVNPMWITPLFMAIEVPHTQKAELIAHFAEKYGRDNVALVSEFQSFDKFDNNNPASSELDCNNKLSDRWDRLVCGVQAADSKIVVADTETMALLPRWTGNHSDSAVVQFEKDEVELLGALVINVCGSEILTHLHLVSQLLLKRGIVLDLEAIPLNDTATIDFFKTGSNDVAFLFEDDDMRQAIVDLRPDSFEDLMMVYALNRPGQDACLTLTTKEKETENAPVPCHDMVAPILRQTHGRLVYHEQVALIFQTVFGFDIARADVIRRHFCHKFAPGVAETYDECKQRALARNLDESDWIALFNYLVHRSIFTFNKAHTAARVTTAWRWAYIKVHFPKEFEEATRLNP